MIERNVPRAIRAEKTMTTARFFGALMFCSDGGAAPGLTLLRSRLELYKRLNKPLITCSRPMS